MNDLIRPPLYGAIHPIESVGLRRETGRSWPTSSGPICETGDFPRPGRSTLRAGRRGRSSRHPRRRRLRVRDGLELQLPHAAGRGPRRDNGFRRRAAPGNFRGPRPARRRVESLSIRNAVPRRFPDSRFSFSRGGRAHYEGVRIMRFRSLLFAFACLALAVALRRPDDRRSPERRRDATRTALRCRARP